MACPDYLSIDKFYRICYSNAIDLSRFNQSILKPRFFPVQCLLVASSGLLRTRLDLRISQTCRIVVGWDPRLSAVPPDKGGNQT